MIINKDTKICISISNTPSNFGTTIHNAGYRALNLNYLYKAFKVLDLEGVITAIKTLNIRGCSVSMPFKEDALIYLDKLDETVSKVGAVNTIVNDRGLLIGYNTDVIGAVISLKKIKVKPNDKVLILGSGGVAKAIIKALGIIGNKNIFITNRSKIKKNHKDGISTKILDIELIKNEKFDVFINATPIGMIDKNLHYPFKFNDIKNVRAVMDVVINKFGTKLIRWAIDNNKDTVHGSYMSFEQAVAQFELYTKKKAPRDEMFAAMSHLMQ